MPSMTRTIGVVIAAIIAVGMASATITFQGVPNSVTGYEGEAYIVRFASGADMVFYEPGIMFAYNNLPLTDEQYHSDFAEGEAAYEAYKNPVIVPFPPGTPSDDGGVYDGNGNIIYPDEPVVEDNTNVDDTQDGSEGDVDAPIEETEVDTPADVVPDNTDSNPGKPVESNVQRVEGTDTYFVSGQEMHVIHPKYARSVQSTVGSGYASQ